MISKALSLLRDQLNFYIESLAETNPNNFIPPVILGNIGQADAGNLSDSLDEMIVLTLVKIEEETTLKNGRHFVDRGNGVEYRNRPINLNLYILFSANYQSYEAALSRLSKVIAFFQGKRAFSYLNSPGAASPEPEFENLKMVLDLHSLSFQETSFLWGSLGGKQMPSVMYKVRLVSIERDQLQESGPYIEQVDISETLL